MKKRIFFTGGGTGGHVYPALAVIEELNKNSEYKIYWIGSKKGMEYSIVTRSGIEFLSIPSGKLRRYFSLHNFIDIFKITAGIIKSFFLFLRYKPDLLFSKGGYVTVPPVIISKLLGINSLTHESDISPGLATRINSKFVNKILLPYKETEVYFSQSMKNKLVVTGNPVREEFYNASPEKGSSIMNFPDNKPVILVLGGSLGAKEVNDLISNSLSTLLERFNIYHQMGSSNYIESKMENYKTVPFIVDNISHILAASHIVITRAGASAVWESATVGIPAIYIPLVHGSRGDQVLNADYAVKRGLALKLSGDKVNCENLLKEIDNIEKERSFFINSMNVFCETRASVNISKVIKELL